jgi:cytochrome P450
MFEVLGKVSIFEQGSLTMIILADAKLAKEVLVTKAKYYHKGDLLKQLTTDVVGGSSIFTAEGGSWKKKNQIISPTFRHTFLKAS